MEIKGLISVELSPEELGLDNAATLLQSIRGIGGTPPDTSAPEVRLDGQIEMVKDRVKESLVRSFTEDAIAKMEVYTEGQRVRLVALVDTKSTTRPELAGTPAD